MDLGWVVETGPFDHNHPLVDDYLAAMRGRQIGLIIVASTHKEGDEITAVIRSRLKDRGVVGDDEQPFPALKPLQWTEAERGDIDRYTGTEVAQFHRNSGPFRAGERVDAATLIAAAHNVNPRHYSVYGPAEIRLAAGDTIRITANGKSRDGRHKVNNGALYRVDGFTPGGNIRLSNGWILEKDFGHLGYGYVATSYASQGKTFDRVLIAMGQESSPAINAETFYVSVSRGREMAKIYTDMAPAVLREHIRRSERRMSAHELMGRPRPGHRIREWPALLAKTVRQRFSQLRDKARDAVRSMIHEREVQYMADDDLMETLTRRRPEPQRKQEADAQDWLLPEPGKAYEPNSRPTRQPLYSLHCILGAEGIRSFQYVGLDQDSSLSADGKAQVIRLRFCGSKITAVTIRGRNMSRLYDYLHQHRIAWVMRMDSNRDFGTGNEPVITAIKIEEEKDDEAGQPARPERA